MLVGSSGRIAVQQHQALQGKIEEVQAKVAERQQTVLLVMNQLRHAETMLQSAIDTARPMLQALRLVQARRCLLVQ